MNILLGSDNIQGVTDKYTVLELDAIRIGGLEEPIQAYCLVENISIPEVMGLESLRDLHGNLIKNYRRRDWNYCEQALAHLRGKWNGELDSFYNELWSRIQTLKEIELDDSWDWAIKRGATVEKV